jgi:hypothetical protein
MERETSGIQSHKDRQTIVKERISSKTNNDIVQDQVREYRPAKSGIESWFADQEIVGIVCSRRSNEDSFQTSKKFTEIQ